LDIEIASSATDAIVSLAGKFDICTIFDACRDFYFQDLLVFVESSCWQLFAIFHKYFSYSATGPTCGLALHYTKWRLDLLSYTSVSFTGFTSFFGCPLYFFESFIREFFGRTEK